MSKPFQIGIGELSVTKDPGMVLKTMALGSCVGIVMLDPRIRAVGLAHIALPDSSIDKLKAMEQPAYFADTAIALMLMKMAKLGCDSRGEGFTIKLIGGANIMDSSGIFNIGKRNILSCRKILWQMKLAPSSEDVGGEFSRTVEVHQTDGSVRISSPGKGVWEI